MRDQVAGKVVGIAFALFLAGIAVFAYRGHSSPLSVGRRMLANDPCGAALHFSDGVRVNNKSSPICVSELRKIDKPCALRELVELMDLPDGSSTRDEVRKSIWRAVQERVVTKAGVEVPTYDPTAPLPLRKKQQSAWRKFLKDSGALQ